MSSTVYSRLSVPGAAATGHRRSANLDVLRALAALSVLVAHAFALSTHGGAAHPRWADDAVALLSSGIWLFFALSGYLIAGPFLRALAGGTPPPAAGRYAMRRAARILPAYWVALAAAIALATGAALHHWWQLPVHGLLLQDLFRGEQSNLLFVAWTLSVEAMFYVFVPVAAWAIWRTRGRRALAPTSLAWGIVALWVASIAWRLALTWIVTPSALAADSVPWSLGVLRWILPAYLCAFAPGALIFLAETVAADAPGAGWRAYRRARRRPAAAATAALVLAVAFTLLSTAGGRWFEIGTMLLGIPAGVGVIALIGDGPRRELLGRVLGPIGLVSYGVYLWHAVIRDALERHAAGWLPGLGHGVAVWPLHALLLGGLTIPVALASWLLIERPLLRRTSSWDRARAAGVNAEPLVPEPLPAPAG